MGFVIEKRREGAWVAVQHGGGPEGTERLYAAFLTDTDGMLERLVVFGPCGIEQRVCKRMALAHAVLWDRAPRDARTAQLSESLFHVPMEVLEAFLDTTDAEVASGLSARGVFVHDAPYADEQALMIAVHDEVWERGFREISWDCRREGSPLRADAGRWIVTVKCEQPQHPFRFWNDVDSDVRAPPQHPSLYSKHCPMQIDGVTGELRDLLQGWSGVVTFTCAWGKDPYTLETRQFTMCIDEFWVRTAFLKDVLVATLLGLLERNDLYVSVVGGFPDAPVLS